MKETTLNSIIRDSSLINSASWNHLSPAVQMKIKSRVRGNIYRFLADFHREVINPIVEALTVLWNIFESIFDSIVAWLRGDSDE